MGLRATPTLGLRMSCQELESLLAIPVGLVQMDADKLTVFALKCQIYGPRESLSNATF